MICAHPTCYQSRPAEEYALRWGSGSSSGHKNPDGFVNLVLADIALANLNHAQHHSEKIMAHHTRQDIIKITAAEGAAHLAYG